VEANKDFKTFYTGGKDCCIIRWDAATGAKTIFKGEKHDRSIQGHYDEVRIEHI
jgi:WD40 repeat protein